MASINIFLFCLTLLFKVCISLFVTFFLSAGKEEKVTKKRKPLGRYSYWQAGLKLFCHARKSRCASLLTLSFTACRICSVVFIILLRSMFAMFLVFFVSLALTVKKGQALWATFFHNIYLFLASMPRSSIIIFTLQIRQAANVSYSN